MSGGKKKSKTDGNEQTLLDKTVRLGLMLLIFQREQKRKGHQIQTVVREENQQLQEMWQNKKSKTFSCFSTHPVLRV